MTATVIIGLFAFIDVITIDTKYLNADNYQENTEYENVFVSVRIATDLRPVYDNQTNETPKAGMISHILHLHYQRGEESDHRDLYVALDSENLKYLKRMIERAEKKAESLRPIFKQSGIIELHPEE